MGRNLTNLPISASFQYLTQISGSELTDGLGVDIDSLNISASYATNAGTATTASYVETAQTASYVAGANVDGIVATATSSSHAIFADTASFLPADTNLNINSITASNASFTSASIGYLQTITGSAKIIGDAFIILNNDTPTERYAGLIVQDSGSTANTASLLFDGQTNDWFYQYTDDGGATDEFGVVMFGPGYNTQGAHVYPADNAILKGTGDHHIVTSSMVDDGTLVNINANVSASGYVSASEFIGDGSKLTGLTTDPFPYTGSAIISGSLGVTGSFSVENNTIDGTELFAGLGATLAANNGNVQLGGVSNTLSSAGWGRVVIGGRSNNLSGGNGVSIWGGFGNTLSGGEDNAIMAGRSNNISGNGEWIVIAGGRSNTVSSANYSAIVGGFNNTITSGQKSVILGGDGSSIGNNLRSFIIGGEGNRVVTGQGGGVVGGFNNQVDHNRSVIVGGASLSTSKDNEVVVENLSVYGDAIVSGSLIGEVGVITPSSNTGSLDCSAGNYFTMTLGNAVDTRLEVSNLQIGQTINLKITNNATAAGTISFASEFEFEGGTAFTATAATNAVDILTFVSFDGTSLQTVGVKNFS